MLAPLCTAAVCPPAWSTDLGGTKFAINPDFAKQTITLAQVQKAIDEIDALAQKQIDSGAAPGLAISALSRTMGLQGCGFHGPRKSSA